MNIVQAGDPVLRQAASAYAEPAYDAALDRLPVNEVKTQRFWLLWPR